MPLNLINNLYYICVIIGVLSLIFMYVISTIDLAMNQLLLRHLMKLLQDLIKILWDLVK